MILKAYEALLLDAFRGDHSNFVRDDELDIAWKVRTEYVMSSKLHYANASLDLHAHSPLD
jgi:glucose-6-phosphate 1-dehydrogenase